MDLMECPFREECWDSLNSQAIEAGRATPGRKFPCGFETSRTVAKCPRQARFGIVASESPFSQLTMDFSYEAGEAV